MSARIRPVVQFVAEHRIVELLAAGLTAIAYGLGFVFITSAAAIAATPSFRYTVMLAPLPVWAAGFITLATAAAALLTRSRRAAQPALAALALVFGTFGVSIIWSLPAGGIPTGFVAYVGLGYLALVTSVACSVPRTPGRRR